MLRRLDFFGREAWQNITRSGIMSLIAASTIAVSLFILGIFLLVFFNFYNLLGMLNSKLDIVVYVEPRAGNNDLDILQMSIPRIAGVRKTEFVSKAAAWQNFKAAHSTIQLDDLMDDNPLPDSFKVEVQDLSYIHQVANQLRALDHVEEVSYGGELAERMRLLLKMLSTGGALIIFILISATLMIVVNTIRLTVLARGKEINIMSLVGASHSFIKYPFLVEGMLLGLFGAVAAMVCLKVGYSVAMVKLVQAMPFVPFSLYAGEINLIFFSLLPTGIFLGWFGAYLSVSWTMSRTLRTE